MFYVAFDDTNYSMTYVSGCYLDMSMEKLQEFAARVNPVISEI